MIEIDLYFGEKKYERIEQVPDYDVTSFFSEIFSSILFFIFKKIIVY